MDTRPFNVEHAKAGAPYAMRNGVEVTILKWNGKRNGAELVGIYGDYDSPSYWPIDGHGSFGVYDLVMTPLGYVEGKPVFTGDILISGGDEIEISPQERVFDFMRWPDPKPNYPETNFTDFELSEIYNPDNLQFVGLFNAVRRIANAAIKRAIDDGQVTVKE